MSTTTARLAGSRSIRSRRPLPPTSGSGTAKDRATAGRTPTSPDASYLGSTTWSNTDATSASYGCRQSPRERHGLGQCGLPVGIGADPQSDVVRGDSALVAMVGLAVRVAAGRRNH